MAFGTLTLKSPGAVTAPSTVGFVLGSATGAALRDHGPSDLIPIPSLKGVMFCDGIDFQYHAIDATSYVTGPLAPGVAPVSTPSAVRATATVTYTAATRPADGDEYRISNTTSPGAGYVITYKDTLPTSHTFGTAVYIKRGANLAACIASVAAFFAKTAVEGTDYFVQSLTSMSDVVDYLGCSISATTATVVTYRQNTFGTGGNSAVVVKVTDGDATWAVSTFAGGSTGTGTTPPGIGRYIHTIARVRNGDHAQTAISPTVSVTQDSPGQIVVGTFGTPPTRDNETHTRTFRSTINGGEQFYKEGDTTASTFTDTLADSTITGEGALLYDSSKYRPYAGGYPTRRRYGTLYRGSVYLTGAVMEAQRTDGTVAVSVGSFAFTFTGTKYKTNIIGRTLRIGSETNEYLIVDFTESTQAGLFNIVYAGAATTSYTLIDERNPYGIEWCVPNKPNQWPTANSLEGVSSPDGSGATGIKTAFDSVCLWTRTGLWQIQGDPAQTIPRFVPVCEGVGAYCGAAIASADGLVYWLGPDGIWGWAGSGTPESISNPSNPAAGSPRGIGDTLSRINAEQVNGIVCDYNRTENVIRWWVPLDGSTFNNHVIVFDTQTGAFAVDDSPPVTCAASIVGADGDYHTLVGTAFGEVWELDLSTSDGAYGFDPLASWSSYSAITKVVAITGTTLPTTGNALAGVAVAKVAANSWPPEIAYIASNTSGGFTTIAPFATAPAAGDKFVFGAIAYRIQSSKCDFGLPEMPKRLASLCVSFTPQTSTTQGQLWCGAACGDNDPTMTALRSTSLPGWADLTSSQGRHLFVLNRGHDPRVQYELYALMPGFDVSIASWKAEIPTLQEVRT